MSLVYDKEFKIKAVTLYLSNTKSIKGIAQDLGISRATLGHWVSQYKREGEQSFPGSGHVVKEELRALRKELHLVRQERDILKNSLKSKPFPLCSKLLVPIVLS